MMKKRRLFCLLLGLITLAVYMTTLCPTIYPGDSPEFVTAAFTLGAAHPPGYPLYCIVGKLFATVLPLGSIAYRVNMMSCFFGVLTVMVLYLLMLRLTGDILLSFCLGLAGAFSKIFWSQSIMAEVYTLNAFFLFLTFYILILWGENRKNSYLFLLSFIYGLGLTNHYLLGLALPVYLLFIWLNRRQYPRPENPITVKPYHEIRNIGFTSLLFLLLGLFVYAYLLIRSSANPPLDWGNPETLTKFIRHIMRLQYRAFETSRSVGLDTKLLFARDFFVKTARQFPFFVWLAGVPGLVWLFKKHRNVFIATLLLFLFNGFSAIIMLQFRFNPVYRGVVEVYYLPAYLLVAVWICCGLKYLLEQVKSNGAKKAVSVVVVCIPLFSLALNFRENNLSRHYFIYDFAKNILVNLEENSFLNLASDDGVVFPMLYMKYVEKYRTDVSMRDSHDLLFSDVYDADSGNPVYYATLLNIEKDKRHMGFVYKLEDEGYERQNEPSWWSGYEKRGLDDSSIHKDFWTRGITARYPFALGLFYFDRGMDEEGKKEFKKAFRIANDIPWILQNIGYAYSGMDMTGDAIEVYERLVKVDRSNSAGYRGLISCYKKLKMQEKVMDTYKALIRIEPDNAELYSVLASLYREKGDDEEAISNYRIAVKKNPDYKEAYNNLGVIYQGRGNIEESVKMFKEALEVDPGYAGAHYNMAIGYMGSDWDKVISGLKEVIRLNPDFGGIHYQLAHACDKKGLTEEAIREYEIELSVNPSHPSAHKNAGILYYKSGRHKKALRHWRKYLELEPDAPDAEVVKKEISKLE